MMHSNPLEYEAVIMAGGIRRTSLHEALARPVLSLPVSSEVTLLEQWVHCLAAAGDCRTVHVIVSDWDDCDLLQKARRTSWPLEVDVVTETGRWRGTRLTRFTCWPTAVPWLPNKANRSMLFALVSVLAKLVSSESDRAPPPLSRRRMLPSSV